VEKDELTATERYVVRKILSEARRSMVWDDQFGEYIDDGSFIMALKKKELAALTRAMKKL
jgi:hypothetical protein